MLRRRATPRALGLSIGLALTTTFGWACASAGGASGGSSANLSYGYMVPGARVGTAMGVSATDTIAEIQAGRTVPTLVANAITQEIAQGTWDSKCVRRFNSGSVYIVIFHRTCDASQGPEADPKVLVGFGTDGRTVGRVPWTGSNTVAALVPVRRF